MTAVQLRGLSKAFGSVGVIHDINLTIADGEFVALVGPSGCGKSTLLRMIAGLEDITDGDILFDGAVVNDLNPKQRNIAMVFQSYALYPHMSVAENIGFNLKIAGVSAQEQARRVTEAARMLNLTELLERRPAQLSGGQRQRVAMGRAVVRDPAVFLFDEPLSNLDAKLRVQMRAEIKLLHKKVETTAIYVTHDQIEAMTLADRIVVLDKGRIQQVGTPLELYRRPVNAFVAGFIGSPAMNFMAATIRPTPAGMAVELADGQQLAVSLASSIAEGTPVTIGIRPEHLTPSAAADALTGTVQIVEPTGAQTHIVLALGGSDVVAIVDEASPAIAGGTFRGVVAPNNVYVFDKVSGERLTGQ